MNSALIFICFSKNQRLVLLVLSSAKKAEKVGQDKSGNRTNTSNSGSRCANFNNALSNSNWNISLRAAGDNWHESVMYAAHHKPLVSLLHLLWRINTWVRITGSSENQKPCRHLKNMGTKHKNLFPKIIDKENLYLAFRKTAKGKRKSRSFKTFERNLGSRLNSIQKSLQTNSYRPGKPRHFIIYEPKKRRISALPFRDRVIQHALCNVIEPLFDKTFLPQSYACRKNKGTHAAARDLQAELRRMKKAGLPIWVLKTDFAKYFASIPLDVLHREFKNKISCGPTLALIDKLVRTEGTGINIGELLSQLSANVIGNVVDRWLVHSKGVAKFFRYMDDIVILGTSKEELSKLRVDLETFAFGELGLFFSHWSIQPVSRGINFVGYRIWPEFKLLRKDSVIRAKRKIKRYRKNNSTERLNKFLASWTGHAKHADSFNLLKYLRVV